MGDKKEFKEHFVDVGRAETDIYVPDPEVAEVFEADKHGHGARSGGREMMRGIEARHGFDRNLLAGDPDANLEDATFVGDDAPGGGHAAPDQTIVDDIGEAMGLQYQDNEPLHTTEKVEDRDRHRWELDPASAEDYQQRARDRSGE